MEVHRTLDLRSKIRSLIPPTTLDPETVLRAVADDGSYTLARGTRVNLLLVIRPPFIEQIESIQAGTIILREPTEVVLKGKNDALPVSSRKDDVIVFRLAPSEVVIDQANPEGSFPARVLEFLDSTAVGRRAVYKRGGIVDVELRARLKS